VIDYAYNYFLYIEELMKTIKLLGLFTLFLLLQACSSIDEVSQPMTSNDVVVDEVAQNTVTTQAMPQPTPVTIAAGGRLVLAGTEEEGSALTEQTILFDFDVFEIRSEYYSSLEAHGDYLANNSGARVRLEGHADERGTREYNIGLGEERAQSARQFLMLQGASSAQVTTISYGEERAVNNASNEAAYAQNRRVELVYTRAN
jgi:peptidoglycan-associated lipoprotein